jgi:glucosamine--fructose-6-phosphate aminotransferase (isomerizing)
MSLRGEIAEQPQVAARLLDTGRATIGALAADARRREIEYVVIAARGSSDHAAVYAQYALGVLAGVPVALAAPSVISRYGGHPKLRRALVLGISQSGRSPDILGVLAEARAQGSLTAAITNDATSPLAAQVDHHLHLGAGVERAVAATKTYSAELVAVAMLTAELAIDPAAAWAALEAIPGVLDAALATEPDAERLATERRAMDDCVVLGRGFNLSSALEWALKLKELAYVRAQAYSSADFEHGPVASLPPGGDLLAISAPGPMADDLSSLLARLRAERTVRTLTLAPSGSEVAGDHLPYPAGLPEWLSPIAAIVPAQLFSIHLTRARGHDPETPRGLHKVTLTR